MTFCRVDFLNVGLVRHVLNPLVEWNDLVVASHDHNGAELKALGEVHGADGDGSGFRV